MENESGKEGISVLICSHNGAKLIGETLQKLAAQDLREEFPWEVVLVDNASTDGLQETAKAAWTGSAPLHIVAESELGIAAARKTGIANCRYDLIVFVDDDNRLYPEFLQTAYSLMRSYPDAGAVGGQNIATFASEPPPWFVRYQGNYAAGGQYTVNGLIEKPIGTLWGAGLVLRKAAIDEVNASGFTPILRSRIGKSGMLSGEETELLLAMRLLGWKLYYDERLKAEHFMTTPRLNWDYHLRLRQGLGASAVVLDMYRELLLQKLGLGSFQAQGWQERIKATRRKLWQDPLAMLPLRLKRLEGNYRVAKAHYLKGEMQERKRLGEEEEKLRARLQAWASRLDP